jgi:hypothetical protein
MSLAERRRIQLGRSHTGARVGILLLRIRPDASAGRTIGGAIRRKIDLRDRSVDDGGFHPAESHRGQIQFYAFHHRPSAGRNGRGNGTNCLGVVKMR